MRVGLIESSSIHIRPLRVEASDECFAGLSAVLSPDERERAGRFRFPELRRSFAITRACLRYLLSEYLELPPGEIQIRYGERGKPMAAGPLRFNLSHSGALAVYAFARDCEVGVDIERMDDARPAAFYEAWTRREAAVKLTGEGLAVPPDHTVELCDLTIDPGYAGALAYRGPRRGLVIFPIARPADLLPASPLS